MQREKERLHSVHGYTSHDPPGQRGRGAPASWLGPMPSGHPLSLEVAIPGTWELERGKSSGFRAMRPLCYSATVFFLEANPLFAPCLSPGSSCFNASCHFHSSLNFLSFIGRDPLKQPSTLSLKSVFPASVPLPP